MNQPKLPDDVRVLDGFDDAAWIEVLQKTEEAYARSVAYQVELEQKNAQLEQAHQFISAILATMSDVLVVVDDAFHITQVNRAFEALSGFTQDEVIGRSVWRYLLVDEAQRARMESTHQTALEAPEVQVVLKGRIHEIPLAVRCSCQQENCPVDVGRVMIGRPIGELLEAYSALRNAHKQLKQTQQKMVHSEKMAALGRLVAGVAHELNNPVSFVYANLKTLQLYLSMLQQHCPTTSAPIRKVWEDMPALIEGTTEGVQRISQLIAQLKQFTRMETDHTEPLRLRQQVEEAINWVVKSRPTQPVLQLQWDLPDTWQVQAHPGRLQQVLINLVHNAVEAMAGQPLKLVISGSRSANRLCVRLRDFGPGISPKLLDKIFEPFFTTKPVGQGTGLGLSISYELTREMDGELSAWNHPEGGAVFQLCLPEAHG